MLFYGEAQKKLLVAIRREFNIKWRILGAKEEEEEEVQVDKVLCASKRIDESPSK